MAIKDHDQDRIGRIRQRTEALIYLEKAACSVADSAAFDSAVERAMDVVQRELHELTKSVSSIRPESTRYSGKPTIFTSATTDYDALLEQVKRNK